MAIHISEQLSLASFTTMHVGGPAKFFIQIKNIDELAEAVTFARYNKLPIFILGAGSNTLFSDTGFSGVVIKIGISGITYDDNQVTAGAGVLWDDLVKDVVEHNLWGIENLSLIPGAVGGAAVQNIGAYGVEARETILFVEAFDIDTMQLRKFKGEECEFGYRESLFKKKKNLIVMKVIFNLIPNSAPRIDYEDVKKYFEEKGVTNPSLLTIREAIIDIRTKKLPAPGIGTAGSFFKNPVVSVSEYETLKKDFPLLKAYPQPNQTIKLSAAWLLDHVGNWRGVRRGDAGVHERQALILVNYGSATANEMLLLANDMKNSIKEKTNIILEEEVVLA